MKVFYTASYHGKQKYQKYYDLVLKAIESTRVELVSPEKGNYRNLLPGNALQKSGKSGKIPHSKLHYEAIRRGITWADAVIIEVSEEDFQLGHEATLAISNKKPVLCLSVNENFGEKIKNPYFLGAKYNEYTARSIVVEFIKGAKRELLSERFNFFLSPSQLKHLEIQSKKHNTTIAGYLRSLIEKTRIK